MAGWTVWHELEKNISAVSGLAAKSFSLCEQKPGDGSLCQLWNGIRRQLLSEVRAEGRRRPYHMEDGATRGDDALGHGFTLVERHVVAADSAAWIFDKRLHQRKAASLFPASENACYRYRWLCIDRAFYGNDLSQVGSNGFRGRIFHSRQLRKMVGK